MHPQLNIHATVRAEGRFRAVVHTGHKYDQFGNVVEYGKVLRETPWNHNLITALGFAAQLSGPFDFLIVVGSGNAAPTLADTKLEGYKGSPTKQTVISRTVNTTPDAEGYCTIETIYRATFNPGSLGTTPLNISEAGTAMSTIPTAVTNLYSRGLLVDDFGVPTAVSIDPAVEYLDIYWKLTRYIPSEIIATQTLNILGTDVPHNIVIRPYSLVDLPDTYHSMYWMNGNPLQAGIPGFAPAVSLGTGGSYGPRFYSGTIGTPTTNPSGTAEKYTGSSWTVSPYVAGSYERKCSLNVIPTEGNLEAGIKTVTLGFGFQGWQMQFDPVIMKNATPNRVLRLDFTITLANK